MSNMTSADRMAVTQAAFAAIRKLEESAPAPKVKCFVVPFLHEMDGKRFNSIAISRSDTTVVQVVLVQDGGTERELAYFDMDPRSAIAFTTACMLAAAGIDFQGVMIVEGLSGQSLPEERRLALETEIMEALQFEKLDRRETRYSGEGDSHCTAYLLLSREHYKIQLNCCSNLKGYAFYSDQAGVREWVPSQSTTLVVMEIIQRQEAGMGRFFDLQEGQPCPEA